MNRRVFKAGNIQEAIASIKGELGPDAMILSTRKVGPTPRNPYAKEMVEIEAAVPAGRSPGPGRSGNRSATVDSPAWESGDRGLKTDVMAAIQEELSGIKDMISIAGLSGGLHQMENHHFESAGILASLLRAGVSEKRARAVIQSAGYARDEQVQKGHQTEPLKNYVMRACVNDIETKDIFQRRMPPGRTYTAAFVGPTGVGKTTTIAKLAALLTYERRLSVGLISIDHYRIGAFEHLKAYGSIMGLPCIHAFSREDLGQALDNMKSKDVVLIDTAGHSHYDDRKIDDDARVLADEFGISIHLVLSVTAESINMKEAAVSFSRLKPETYVFTKIDETTRCGKILDQITDYRLPVSMITNGQQVPEDLIVPDRKELLKVMLGRGRKGYA